VGRSPQPLTPGEWIEIEIELESTTWMLERGHVLRLAVAGTDWPNCWPPPGPLTLDVDAGALELALPLVTLPDSTHEFTPGSGPAPDEAEGVDWRIEHDVLHRETRAVTRYGGTYDGLHGATVTDDYRGEVGVSVVDPAQSWARGRSAYLIEWPEGSARTEATLEVTSDADTFEVTMRLRVHDGDDELADRTWHMSLPR
jgi:hypothetical protein